MFRTSVVLATIFAIIKGTNAIYCYQCVSTQPGCGTDFNWWWRFWGDPCPEDEDICVKIIERKGATEVYTRQCLSNLRAIRADIPPDHYEGCRPSAHDPKLAHYVNNSIKELDIKRNYYDQTIWCFCFLDHRCNSAVIHTVSAAVIVATSMAVIARNLT